MDMLIDALPSSLLDPFEGPSMWKCERSWNLGPLPTSSTKRGERGVLEVPGLDYEEGQLSCYTVLHPKPTTSWLIHIREHLWCWDKPHATRTHWTYRGPDSGEITTFPHIVYSAFAHRGYIRMALFPGTSKVESRKCPKLDSQDFGHHNFSPRCLIGTRSKPIL
jgi:hypothetical protein